MPGLSIDARRTLTTMGAELSAEFATFEPDDLLIEYVKARNPAPFEPQYPDPDASYAARRRIDLGALRPMLALPDSVIRNAVPVADATREPIQQAFIGSCANGTLDDLAEAARVLKGRRVAPGVRLLVTPGSQRIAAEAARAGYTQILLEAGAVVTAGDLRRLLWRAHGRARTRRDLHHREHAQFPRPHGARQRAHLHGVAGYGGGVGGGRTDRRRIGVVNRP